MNISSSNNKCCRSLPQDIVRRQRFWEGNGVGTSRPFDSGLDAVRFLLERIYSDGSINLNTVFGNQTISAEEMIGSLLCIRDDLIQQEIGDSMASRSPSDFDIPIRIRISGLRARGYTEDETMTIVRYEYDDITLANLYDQQKKAVDRIKRQRKAVSG